MDLRNLVMRDIIVDTSIIINFTRGKDKIFQEILAYALSENAKVYIPTIVLVEIFVGKEMLDEKRENEVRKLLAKLERIELSEEIAILAAKLARESNLPFDVADFVVAATALYLNAQFATKNVKHFKQIPKLKIFDFKSISS